MPRKPSKKKLIELAETYAGVQKDIAEACGVVRQTVAQWQLKDPDFNKAMKNGNETLINLAVRGLRVHLVKESEKSIHFTLDRLARDKGFGKFVQIQDKSKFEEQLKEKTEAELAELYKEQLKKIEDG